MDITEIGRRVLQLLDWLFWPRWRGLAVTFGTAGLYFLGRHGLRYFVRRAKLSVCSCSRLPKELLAACEVRRRGQFGLSTELLKQYLGRAPSQPLAMQCLGLSYADWGLHLEEAEALLLRAREILHDPGRKVTLYKAPTLCLSWVYLKRGMPERISDCISVAADEFIRFQTDAMEEADFQQHEPFYADQYFYLGAAYEHLGEQRLATHYFKESIESDPQSVFAKWARERLRSCASSGTT